LLKLVNLLLLRLKRRLSRVSARSQAKTLSLIGRRVTRGTGGRIFKIKVPTAKLIHRLRPVMTRKNKLLSRKVLKVLFLILILLKKKTRFINWIRRGTSSQMKARLKAQPITPTSLTPLMNKRKSRSLGSRARASFTMTQQMRIGEGPVTTLLGIMIAHPSIGAPTAEEAMCRMVDQWGNNRLDLITQITIVVDSRQMARVAGVASEVSLMEAPRIKEAATSAMSSKCIEDPVKWVLKVTLPQVMVGQGM